MKALTLVLILSLAAFAAADNFAVIVAGSNGFYNYRHQSDVCHAYHLLLTGGIPASNIIVMSYNDVASSPQNPFPNTLFNKPTGTSPGVDVNQGCVIDYEKGDVTPSNYLAIITGDSASVKGGNGRVLKSGPNDIVFLNFADHGAEGLIAFPSEYLYADDLLKALATMTSKKMYKQLTYYLESCESGSMFVDLPKDTGIYGLSAANPTESSWATYCSPDDEVNGKHIGSCLGDLFSVNWMEDTDAADRSSETLQTQFEAVLKLTTQSHVMQWGDLSYQSEPIGTFVGSKSASQGSFLGKVMHFFEETANAMLQRSQMSRDVKVNYLLAKFNQDPSNDEIYAELAQELATTKMFNGVFKRFQQNYSISGIYSGSTNFECYKSIVSELEGKCGKLNDQSQKNLKYLYQYCAMYSNWQNTQFEC